MRHSFQGSLMIILISVIILDPWGNFLTQHTSLVDSGCKKYENTCENTKTTKTLNNENLPMLEFLDLFDEYSNSFHLPNVIHKCGKEKTLVYDTLVKL